jgi:hypothetical protein
VPTSRATSTTTPVICVELDEDATRNGDLAALRDELLELAAENPTTRPIRRVLFHPRLPVDPRHNSKIERPELSRWAAEQPGAWRDHPRTADPNRRTGVDDGTGARAV